jgi:hypothetical protein
MSKNHSFAHADATRRHGMSSAGAAHRVPMEAGLAERLAAWFSGEIALSRAEAHRLLESLVESDPTTQHRAEFVAAVKALAVGPKSWHDRGYRLLPDD